MGLTGNYHLVMRSYDVALPRLCAAYDGFRILQVSDMHNAARELVGGLGSVREAARAACPHVIVLTGDLMDRHRPDPDAACGLVAGLARIAPTYYVTGNHERTPIGPDGAPLPYRAVTAEALAALEARGGVDDLFARHGAAIVDAGARVLEGRAVALAPDGSELAYALPSEAMGGERVAGRDGKTPGMSGPVRACGGASGPAGSRAPASGRLVLCGVRDPWPLVVRGADTWDDLLDDVAARACALAGDHGATVLLSHRPERVASYARAGVDVALTGHAHGGQVRLPLIGALIAPNQGLFPRYDRGVYHSGATTLVVSSGVGTTGYRLRLLCPPEVVLVTLRCAGMSAVPDGPIAS